MNTVMPSLRTEAKDDSISVFAPMRMLDLELSQPLPVFSAFDPKTNQTYQRASCLVRLHTRPIGTVELFFIDNELHPQEYVEQIWKILGSHINRHLQEDAFAPIAALHVDGIPYTENPRWHSRARTLF